MNCDHYFKHELNALGDLKDYADKGNLDPSRHIGNQNYSENIKK